MQKQTHLLLSLLVISFALTACGGGGSNENSNSGGPTLTAEQELGKKLFFDRRLSDDGTGTGTQSCADCHDPASGFADPNTSDTSPVSEGAVASAFGNRNAPTAAYTSFIPPFRLATSYGASPDTPSKFEGGQFLDGRRPSLKEQAKDPFLNPVEMNNTDATDVVSKVQSFYEDDFKTIFDPNIFNQNTDLIYDKIAEVIAAFEASDEVNPFSSKFDRFLNDPTIFSEEENRGFELFKNKAKCANCHTVDPDPDSGKVLFTNFKYFNIGTPPNPSNPSVAVDGGLGDSLNTNASQYPASIVEAGDIVSERGKFRTPTLRNVSETAPYMHNGRYQELRDVILHYDTVVSNAELGITPVQNYPEVDENIADELNFGDPNFTPALGLSNTEINDLVLFLETLTDGYTP